MNSYDRLIKEVEKLGFPKELGFMIAKNLRTDKLIDRITQYIIYSKPRTPEVLVDEMLAIMAERDAWIAKKQAEHANYMYTEYLNSDIRQNDDFEE